MTFNILKRFRLFRSRKGITPERLVIVWDGTRCHHQPKGQANEHEKAIKLFQSRS
jgi:hypothetical protein